MVFLYIVLFFVVTLCILALIPGYTSSIKDNKGNPLQGSIASLEKINLGGQEQWILIRGMDIKKPVILFLHGGPGTADMCLLRKYTTGLQKHFVVVSWDQRGAGKSFTANDPDSSMNINKFISDAHELTKMLCHRFNQEKIFLVGHSWGSVLGVLTIHKYPELFHAYTGISQIVNIHENERISYGWTLEQAKKSNDKRAVKILNEIGNPPYSGDWQKKFMTQRRLLGKYGGELYGSTKGAFPLIFGNLLRCTEYTLFDKVNFFRGIFSSVRLIWPELMRINLMELALSLKVPVYFVSGKHDYEAPHMLTEQYFKMLEAPSKEMIWFENSAHLPNIEENEKFNNLLINHVLPSVYTQESLM
jgi:pimeloyl-ACP methyl ester carboxylesterase